MPAPKIISEGQWKLLLDYMEANPVFAKGIAGVRTGQEAKEENNALWNRLAHRLNSVGTGCIKNYPQWRDYWNNIKYKVRKKASAIWKHMRGTTSSEPLHRYYLLTKNEKRVLKCLGLPIPAQVQMKIRSSPVSPTPDVSQSPPDVSLPQSNMSPPASPSPDTPMRHIQSEPDTPCIAPPRLALPLHYVPMERKASHGAPSTPEWVRNMEERRIAAEERSARALQGIHSNTEFCVSALQGIQYSQECLNKTLQGIQTALEASARALQQRRN